MDLHNHMITRGVLLDQHHENTQAVFNPGMKTIGERIRQARDARGLSQEELAHAVGYAKQSAIGNLENRATGNGGNKITQIARALRVPVQWLLSGPDGPDVPYSTPLLAGDLPTSIAKTAHQAPPAYEADASLTEAMTLFRQLNTAHRMEAIEFMQELTREAPLASQEAHGDRDSVPHKKAA
jgi:transcriptional regulator with XRE-family HTH domain